MSEQFVSPCPLPTEVEREILTVLAEEAAEVIQRVAKALRFGMDEIQPGQEATNRERLSLEVGDFFGMVAFALEANLLEDGGIEHGQDRKAVRFKKYRQFGDFPCDHDWVDMRNPMVESGEMCIKCRIVRASNCATGGPAP